MKKNRVVCFGEVLMRLNAPHNQRFSQANSFEVVYAGSEANVAVLLANLGKPSVMVTALPDNELGQVGLNQLRQYGIDVSAVAMRPGRLGLFFTEPGISIRPGNIIYDRANSSFANLAPGSIPWSEIFQGASWFHWSGISPAVSASAAAVCLEAVMAAKKSGLTISADFNYRSKLWQYGEAPSNIMPQLLSYCDVIYGDIDTAEIYFGIKPDRTLSRSESLEQCGQQLRQKLPGARAIAMTFREQSGSSMRYSGVLMTDTLHYSTTYELGQVVERIGSGDAFMGGLIFAMSDGMKDSDAIEVAVAAGALKHTVTGDFALITLEEIKGLMKNGSTFGKISR